MASNAELRGLVQELIAMATKILEMIPVDEAPAAEESMVVEEPPAEAPAEIPAETPPAEVIAATTEEQPAASA